MKKKLKIFFDVLLVGLFFVLIRDGWVVFSSEFVIYGVEDGLVVRTDGAETLLFGGRSQEAEGVRRAVSPYFSRDFTVDIGEVLAPAVLEGRGFSLRVLSENVAWGRFGKKTVWFFDGFGDEDVNVLKYAPVALLSDIWILRSGEFPDFLPAPRGAILSVRDKKPRKALLDFALNSEIPLITFWKTGGFSLSDFEGEYLLKTQRE